MNNLNVNNNENLSPTEYDSNDLSKFVQVSLVDIITDKIRTNIYTGKYQPGKKLIVRELSEEFNVSHTPIKDALNRLISEGYVEALPRKSMIVRAFTNHDRIDSLQVRLIFEIFSAEEIIECASKHSDVAEEMNRVHQAMHSIVENKDFLAYESWVNLETQFHRCYMKYLNNNKLFDIYKSLDTNRITYFAYLNNSHAPLKLSTLESNVLEHKAILDSIVALDSQRFINAVIRHVIRSCDDYATDEVAKEKIEKLKNMAKVYET